jgi:hypothetical protein
LIGSIQIHFTMKKHIYALILFVFAVSALHAQDTIRGFIYSNDGLIKWQHEFSTTNSIDQLCNYMIENRIITENSFINMRLSGVLNQLPANYKLAGFTKAKTPNYLMAYDFTANVLVQFKPGKYRVTLSRIRLVNNGSNYSFTNPNDYLEEFATNKKGISPAFKKASATILDTTFVNYFTITSIINDEW